MILKKPYAFIIKHFRIIHLLLLIPMLYLVLKTRAIETFFIDYVNNGYQISGNIMLGSLSASYVNIFMYIAVILIIAVFVVVAFILQNKSKPTRYYSVGIIYYILVLVLLTVSLTVFQSIEADILDNTLANIIRDIAVVVHYSQYALIFYAFIRGIGFNIRKFDFKGDIEDLQISSEDSEEFEFLVGRDTYKTKRTIRRFLRELKYYYKENKFIFSIIFVVLIIVTGSLIYTNKEIVQKQYNQSEMVAFGYINVQVNKSYITDIDYRGNKIKDNKKYLVLQVTLTNRYRNDNPLNYYNFRLVFNKQRLSPDLAVGNYFQDMGMPYQGTLIKGNSKEDYVIAYELNANTSSNDYKIEAYSGYDYSKGGIGALTRKIKLKPIVINSNIYNMNINKNTIINLEGTDLGKTEFAIKDYELTNRFVYTQNGILKEIYIDILKDVNKTLMVMDYSLALDNESIFMGSNRTYRTFFENFMRIKYVVNDKTYYQDVALENPANYSDKLVFKIDKNIGNATEVEAIITIRNKSYTIKLK